MDPVDVGGVLAEGLVKQDQEDAEHAAIDDAAAAAAAAAGADEGADAAAEAADADRDADAAKEDEQEQDKEQQHQQHHYDHDAGDVVPVYVDLPMPQAEAAALGPKASARCHALSNAEAALLLKGFAQQERAANPAFEASAAQQRAAKYAERMGGSRNADAVMRMRDLLHEAGLHEFEAVLVMNLAPETADEALALVPSLKEPPGRFDGRGGVEAVVEKLLADVAAYRAFD